MHIFISYKEFEDDTDPIEAYLPTLKKFIESDFGFTIEKYDTGNAGRGADWAGLLVWLGVSAYGIFCQGKSLNENLEGWINLAQKLNMLFKVLAEKLGPVRIDLETARLLGLGKVLESNDVKSVELSHEHKVAISPLYWREEGRLDREPEAYYYFFFKVERDNDSSLETVMVRSNGKISEHQKQSLNWWDFDTNEKNKVQLVTNGVMHISK